MGDFDTTALRSAGLEWHAHAQGSDEECAAGSELVEYADAAADEIDRLRAELDAASLWATTHRHFSAEVERVVGLWRTLEAGGGTGDGINCQLADSRRIGAQLATAAEALLGSLRKAAPTKAQRLSEAGDRRDWDECERIKAEDA